MKKIVKLTALVMAMLMLFCSCGTKEEEKKTSGFDYSYGIDENGFWKDIKTADYVTVADFDEAKVTDDEVNLEISQMLATEDYMLKIPNSIRAAENGDTVQISYTGSIDGVVFDGGSTGEAGTEVTIGVTNYIDDFLYQVIGHKAGDEFDINVTFPDDYENEELNGKDAVFKTKLIYVYDYEQNDLTDSFVEEYFGDSNDWHSVADLKRGVKGYIRENYIYNYSQFADTMPTVMTEQYMARTKYETEQYASYYSMTADEYVSAMYGSYGFTTLDSLLSYYESYASEAAKTYVLYQAIAEANNLKVEDADLQRYYELNEMTENTEEAVEFYGMPFIKAMALYQKVADFIYDYE